MTFYGSDKLELISTHGIRAFSVYYSFTPFLDILKGKSITFVQNQISLLLAFNFKENVGVYEGVLISCLLLYNDENFSLSNN